MFVPPQVREKDCDGTTFLSHAQEALKVGFSGGAVIKRGCSEYKTCWCGVDLHP